MTLTEYQTKPVLDVNGKPWVQNCYLCGKQINFRKDPWRNRWVRSAELVRHKRCQPAPLK